MKVIISSTGSEKTTLVDKRFGRCEYFFIYDTETKEYESVENKAGNSNSGAGVASAQSVIDLKAEVVLTGNLGPKAMQVLEGSKVDSYYVEDVTIEEAIESYLNGNLKSITSPGRSKAGM